MRRMDWAKSLKNTENAWRDPLFQETMIFAQLAVVRTCRATLEVTERDIMEKTIFEIRRVRELFSYH